VPPVVVVLLLLFFFRKIERIHSESATESSVESKTRFVAYAFVVSTVLRRASILTITRQWFLMKCPCYCLSVIINLISSVTRQILGDSVITPHRHRSTSVLTSSLAGPSPGLLNRAGAAELSDWFRSRKCRKSAETWHKLHMLDRCIIFMHETVKSYLLTKSDQSWLGHIHGFGEHVSDGSKMPHGAHLKTWHKIYK